MFLHVFISFHTLFLFLHHFMDTLTTDVIINIPSFSFRKLRRKLPIRIQLSLCVSLLIFLVIFISGSERTKHRLSCQMIAGLLHYFMMTTFAWMCVTAVHLYLLLVKVRRMESEVFRRFFTKVSILAWGKLNTSSEKYLVPSMMTEGISIFRIFIKQNLD